MKLLKAQIHFSSTILCKCLSGFSQMISIQTSTQSANSTPSTDPSHPTQGRYHSLVISNIQAYLLSVLFMVLHQAQAIPFLDTIIPRGYSLHGPPSLMTAFLQHGCVQKEV